MLLQSLFDLFFLSFFNPSSNFFQDFFNSPLTLLEFFFNTSSTLLELFFNSSSTLLQLFFNSFSFLLQSFFHIFLTFFNPCSISFQHFFNSSSTLLQLFFDPSSIHPFAVITSWIRFLKLWIPRIRGFKDSQWEFASSSRGTWKLSARLRCGCASGSGSVNTGLQIRGSPLMRSIFPFAEKKLRVRRWFTALQYRLYERNFAYPFLRWPDKNARSCFHFHYILARFLPATPVPVH